MRILSFAALLSIALLGCTPSGQSPAPSADALYTNAQIWTGNPDAPWADSLAIDGNRIVALGTAGDILDWQGPDTTLHDLDGAFVTPGFQDSHLHLTYLSSARVDLAGAETLADIQTRIRDFAAANPDAPWIEGFGWGYGAFPDQRPLAAHLDGVIPDRPVFIASRDDHMALANSRAMSIAGIALDTPDPENGRIVRGPDGAPTGEVQETAMDLIRRHIPAATADRQYQALLVGLRKAASHGITAFHEAGIAPSKIALFERAEAEGGLLQRVDLALRMVTPEDRTLVPVESINTHIAEAAALRNRHQGPLIRVRSVKGMLDGTIDATTAAMFDDYVGTDTAGLPFWDAETLNQTVALYDAAGFQLLLHAIGDRAISNALDAFAHAERINGPRERRHRVEHAELPRLADLDRFRALGVTASTQPMFAYPDTTVLENFAPLLGHGRAQHADNFALWDGAGIPQVFGSDHPVITLSVLQGIETAVTRTAEDGTPPGGWYPDGRIPVDAALRHYTSDAAWATHDKAERGTLDVGKLADFVVLSDNLLDIDPKAISDTRILRTVMGGRTTYNANE